MTITYSNPQQNSEEMALATVNSQLLMLRRDEKTDSCYTPYRPQDIEDQKKRQASRSKAIKALEAQAENLEQAVAWSFENSQG
jgi:hypothetical protein